MKLLEKIHLGSVSLKNRIAMAAMTRGRTDSNGLVGGMTVEYYTQRAGRRPAVQRSHQNQ